MSEPLERFDIRLPAGAKRMLAQAADLTGNTLTGLVLNAALDKAREILEAHRYFVLSAEEWRDFTATLDAPPAPTEALRNAWREYHAAAPE